MHGGAELSAYNLAQWLVKQGAEVGVLTTAKTPEEVCADQDFEGMKIWRVWMPRQYPHYYYATAKWWQKPLWHLQDHFDPRNRKVAAKIIEVFKPDYIHIHVLQGLGYNILRDIAKSGAETAYFLHDLSLACFRMSMFRKGRSCETKCGLCRISSAYKLKCLKKIRMLDFISPSRANLETISRHFPIKYWPNAAILNANRYPSATIARTESERLRILYVGRLQPNKGIDLLLAAADNLAVKYPFTVTVIGSGPQEAELHDKYGKKPWCNFTGFINQQEISNYMINSDILCVPSVWAENSPGVIIHALSLGLPVMGSDKAGIPELVEHRKNGLLVPPGDALAWQTALETLISDPSMLTPWRAYARENAYKFEQDYIGDTLLNFLYSA